MVEKRCPMCGQDNPAHAELCEHCQARLTPLMIDPADQDRELGGSVPGFDKTDNLADSRLAGLGESPDPLDEESVRVTEEWQAAFQTESQLPDDELPQTIDLGGPEGDEPDWLNRIREAEKESPAPLGDPLAKQEEIHQEDWLDSVRSRFNEEDQTVEADDESDDWINRIREKKEQEESGGPISAAPDETWLADAESVIEEPKKEETRDWLSGITGDLSDYVFPDTDTGGLVSEELKLDENQPPPDWMLDTVEPESEIKAVVESPFEEEPAEEDPMASWLSQDKGTQPEAAADAAAAMPDWITDMAEKGLPSDIGLPDDLSQSLDEIRPDDRTRPSAEEQIIEDDLPKADIPDWLSPSEPQTEAEDTPSDALPDWVEKAKPSAIFDTIVPAESTEIPESELTASDPWDEIRSLPTEDQTADLEIESEEAAQTDEPKPDWLSHIGSTGPLPASADIPSTPAFANDIELDEADFEVEDVVLPDWMSELDPESDQEPFFPEEDEESLELAPAELPTWLQAMRPVELMAEDELLDPIEGEEVTAGPLAGLRGVLPAEPEIVQFGKPPEYPSRLQITEKQQQYANLMETMIQKEDEVQEIEQAEFKLPQQVLRWLAAGLLLAAVLIPVFFGTQQIQMPVYAPPEVLSSLEIINDGFENKAPVLAVFDYQPALSAELEAAAGAVLDHMMVKGAHLALISTSPTGPGLAETFLQQKSDHSYLSNQEYIQLGYLSGGASGISAFARTPRLAIPLMVDDGEDGGRVSIWDYEDIDNIASINDFSAVLLITDDPDNARNWIEQTSGILTDTPLLVVISAQAEPFVFPYYQVTPRQVDGIIAGLRGAAYYENNTASSTARKYWDAYSYGITAALIMLLAGTGYWVIAALMEKRKAAAGGKKS